MSLDARYVRLGSRYLLRGWQDLPYALVDHRAARAAAVPKAVFDTLRLCNGRFRTSDPIFLGARRKHLEQLVQKDVLAFSDEPSSLEPEQEFRQYPNRFLRKVHWSVTGSCNYRCRHCYMSAPHAKFPKPSTQEALRIVDQMADCGILSVSLTGGEALTRGDFLEIVSRLVDRGIRIEAIMSNGALVTEGLLHTLRELDVRCRFDMSFDGTDGWHDWLRGVDGAEEAAIRALELCQKHGFPTGIQYTLHKGSVAVLRESVRMLGRLGVTSVKVGSLEVEGEARDLAEYALGYDELLDVCEHYLPQYFEDGMPVPAISLARFFMVENGVVSIPYEHFGEEGDCARMPTCGALRTCMYLTSDGYTLPCIMLSYADDRKELFPKLSEASLCDVLSDSLYLDFMGHTLGDYLGRNPKCGACAYRNRCAGGCRARGFVDSGDTDAMAPDIEACRFFLDGYHDRVRDFIEGLGVESRIL